MIIHLLQQIPVDIAVRATLGVEDGDADAVDEQLQAGEGPYWPRLASWVGARDHEEGVAEACAADGGT